MKAEKSICIVTYNNEDKIADTLQSIYSVTDEDTIVYVSDNNSQDNTIGIIKLRFPQTVIIENGDNKGFGHANNKVIPLLNSKFHFIVNPDILVSDDVFSKFGEYFYKNSQVVMAVPKLIGADGKEQFTPKLEPKLHYMIGGRFERIGNPFKRWREEYTLSNIKITEPIEVGFCSGCFICIRTEVFQKLGGFDERYFLYSEDADLTREAKSFGKTMYNPQISVTHSWERAYMKKKKYFFIQIVSMFRYFRKWRKRSRHGR